jgi:hypothetical protein
MKRGRTTDDTDGRIKSRKGWEPPKENYGRRE